MSIPVRYPIDSQSMTTSSVATLPFAPGAKGNVATEDDVMLCESMGYQTGIDMPALLDAVALLGEMIGSPQGGRAHTWLTKQCA